MDPCNRCDILISSIESIRSDVSDMRSELRESHDAAIEQIALVREDVAGLKVKAGLWGATTATLVAFITAIATVIKGCA